MRGITSPEKTAAGYELRSRGPASRGLDALDMEALICSKDWIRAARIDQSNVSSILDDFVGLGVDDIAGEEGAPADAGHQSGRVDLSDN